MASMGVTGPEVLVRSGGEMQDRETALEIAEEIVRGHNDFCVGHFKPAEPWCCAAPAGESLCDACADLARKIADALQLAALASPLSAPPQEPTGDSPQADVTCEHGTAMDVHCCNCHSGFIFDVNHECPSPELTWREAVEQALGVANDPENHTPSWAFDVVMAAREIGNAPSPASPQAETRRECTCLGTCRGAEGLGPRWKCALETPAPVSPVEPTPPTLECCACGHLNTPQQATRLEGEWRSSGEYVCLDSDACARRIAECSEPPVEPTPEPETCEWRITTGPLGIWVTPFCVEGSIPAPWGTERAKSCHLCGKPLRLVPSEETK